MNEENRKDNNSGGLEAAGLRIGHALRRLQEIDKTKQYTLSRCAEAVVRADELLSALSLIFDRLYAANVRNGLIKRRADVRKIKRSVK